MDTGSDTGSPPRSAAVEPGEEEEAEERVRPIATTPPCRAWREESLSRSSSSSGTQECGSSGASLGAAISEVSLGAAIPQETTAAARGMEPWFRLPAEAESSCSSAALDTRLGLSCGRQDLSEFPTLEEGLLPSAEASPGAPAPASLLDVQESRFSPCLPLLLSPARDETFLQGSQMDFIALRGIPDVSGASLERSEPSHVHGSASLRDAAPPRELCASSQHCHPVGPADPGAASQSSLSGERLGSEEGAGDRGTEQEAAVPRSRGHPAHPAPEEVLGKGLERPWSTAGKDGLSPPGSDGPAAGSELSEKDKESPGQEESSSSGNSSYTTALTKFSERSEGGMRKEKVKVLGSEAGVLEKQEKGKKVPELDLPNNFSDGLRRGHSKNSGAQDVLCAVTPEPGRGVLEEHGVELEGSEGLRLRAAPGELQGALLDHQQEQPSGRLGREELVPAVAGTGAWAPRQPQGPATDTAPGTEGSPGGAGPAGGRDELTGSDFSIESGHKGTEISPSFSLGAEGSFSVHLPHPNFQSTPGIFLKKAGKAEGRGVLVIPSDLQASSLCSNEETSGKPPAHTPGSLGKQHRPQSAPKETCEHFESLKPESPHPGRIQSFPSLSFMEKVGAWNMSQPEEVPDAVSSGVPAGFPPGRKASNALAMAPSSILSVQKSLRDPQDCAAPSCREAGSLGSLHFPHTEPLPAPRLSRSRSDNAVNVRSRSRAWAGVTPAANSAEALQPPGEKSPALGGLDSTSGGCTTPEVVPGSRGEDVESTARRSSAPAVFVSSVAQFPKKDGSSPADEHKDCDAQENQPLSLNIPTGHNIMDSFGAISLESLDVPVSSGEPQGALGSARGSARGSLVVPRPCPSAGGDTSIPAGAVLETPKKEEFNIEERIPVYLRNLGIEQSPGTILAPFVPRRPLRELEFSPVELRTLKDPLDRLARAPPQAQGELLPAFEMSHVSFDSDISTPSVSIPVESEAGSGALSPRELCPSFPGLFGEAPVSQGSVSGPQLEVAAPGPTAQGAERSTGSAGAEPGLPRCSSGRESPRLGGTSARDPPADRGPRSSDSSLQEWAAGILSGVKNKMESDRGSQTPSMGSESSKGQEGDSLMGSGALRELRELLAQAEELAASCAHPASPTASCRETGESSPVLLRKEDDPKDSRLGKDWIPQLQKRLPWDEAATLKGVRGEGLGINALGSDPCRLGWGNPLGVGLQRSEGLKGMAQEPRTGKSAGRSEPEGCSSVTTDRNQPARVGLAQSSASSDLSTGTAPELGSPPPLEPLGSIPAVLGGSRSSSSLAGVAGRAGGTRGSDDSSSGDSLSARVRSLLGNPPCSQQPGSAMGAFQSILPAAGAARIQAGSGSSSGDSLAARVRSLLRAGSPGIDASRILRSAEEQERKIRAWVKLKLASQSQESGPDWDEETQQKIERIKAELLPKTRNAAQAKDPWLRGLEAASEYLRKQEQDPEHFQAPTFPRDRHRQLSRAQELFQSSSRPAVPFPRADPLDCSLLQDMELKPWRGAELQDMELKPWRGAEVQDKQLKAWNGAELQDMELKPWSGAELQDKQLKAWNGAELQDMELKPWRGAEGQDMELQPWRGAEGQDKQLQPWNGAELQDMELKAWRGAEGQDMELQPWRGAELRVCSRRLAVGRPGAVAELRAALEWGPGAGSSAAAPAAHQELPLPAAGLGQGWEEPSASLTLCPPRRPPALLGALARSPSLPRDGLEGILPMGPLSAGAGEERRGSEPWERSQSCPPSPTLASTGGDGAGGAELPPVSADSARARARQATACAAQDPGKRQTLSAKHLYFVTAEVTEGDRQSARPGGLNSSTGAGQEINPLIEPHSPSSSQQEKIPPGHTQLCESSEGSDAAAQMGLLKGHGEVLAEERKSPGELRPVPKEAAREQMGPSQPLPADEALSTTSETPPSPVRKFLSCVHITLSSRVRNSELHSAGNAGNGMTVWDKPQGRAQAVTLKAAPEASVESVPEFPPAEGVPEDCSSAVPVASAYPSRVFSSRQELLLQGRARAWLRGDSGAPGATGIPSSTLPAKPGRRTSDAATQITTESPTKTTFSAEVCVDPQEGGNAAQQPSLPKAPEPPSVTTSSHKEIPPFPRQPAQPLLLPYKPSGSSGMYYVPYQKPGANVSPGESEASGDSSRSELTDRSKAVKPSQSVPRSSRLSLPRPMPTSSSCCLDSRDFCRDAPGAGHAPPSSGTALARAQQHQWGSCVPLRRGGEREFFALTAEADESRNEDLGASASSLGKEAAGMELHQEAAGSDPLPRAQTTVLEENVGKAPRQRSHSRGSLDELWVKFLERRSRHQQQDFGNNGELSLVERLDRLARVLQNPIRHTLALAPAGEKVPEEKVQGREQTETRLAGKARSGSSVEPKGARAGERPCEIHGRNSLEGPGERRIHHLNRILEEHQYLEAPSDTSSETRRSGDPSSCSTSGWDTGTQAGLDSPEGSSSVSTSTIDTARLLRAFGQHRLRLAPRLAPKLAPRLSPRLAQLYCAISHQKSRSEDESSGAGAAGCPQDAAEGLGKRQQTQSTIPFSSDSTCASSNSWGPSSALSNKRRTRMLNKEIQAGDLEIVSSATRKNTRDVGVTFPTPRSSQQLQEPPGPWQGGRGGAAGAWHQLRVVLPVDRRIKRNRLHFQQGTPWLVPAEDLKCESRKENQCSAIPGPGPAWFEPWSSSSKPWREPLREKNWEEQQQQSAGQAAAAHPGAAKGLGQPLGKLTLQEALALHRPDFISRSGQRLRHLRLLQEERRLQGLLQSQQEQLLQPPGKRKDCRSGNHLVSHRGFLRKEKRRAIPKSEMVQRSKRIYEQLPEVRKKREEEQRRLEYGSYRLRAQLYKTKITNRVLGKKVSWS
ncbi:Alstrom syndrome protein 1 isoform X3 [Corvus hawaiiensis]|uniref:Alstrom syndrome protein 1 isoform X3 n=1 Tax=Corvus hawaiiensis TaxID=134902 RepID=UPI002019F27C|nr:Alstrom syndrome protein 1 isoform X3 [Corvus hawaiiensis]